MIQFLLVVIFISAAVSLLSYVYCWQDIRSGRPHIISLRQITNIMDRLRLNQWFGTPEPGYFYVLPPEVVRWIMRWRAVFFYRECLADIVCLIGAWWFSVSATETFSVYAFIVMAGVCQGINLLYSYKLLQKWGHQIREEIENSED